MKKLLILASILLLNMESFASANCFIAKENGALIKQEGTCAERRSPASTFKIAISLMGYNENILVDETHPELPFKKGYVDHRKNWQQPHNPTNWIKNSCVWYSQIITKQIGMNKFKDYIAKFSYGNQNVFGNNALTESWLSGSLKISPEEQIKFLEQLLASKLAVSAKAQEFTRNILYISDLTDGWKLYGKTGAGSNDKNYKFGWFVGWVEKDMHKIIFANYVEEKQALDSSMGAQAKELAIGKLRLLISNCQSTE
jgi:beta-lactamase class D